jgi:hypothetical protein
MTRSLLIPRKPDPEQPVVVYHVGIDARSAGAALKLLFLNFPSRADLLTECDMAHLSEARFMIERVDWPTEWTAKRRELRIDVPGLQVPLGRISVTCEVLIANSGRLAVTVRE